MEAEEREDIQKQSAILRQELKVWEKEFAAANGGRKATRGDIKQHPSIAQKYKEYNRSRDILSGKAVSQAPSSPHTRLSRKRKHDTTQFRTPSKRFQIATTPSKSTSHPAAVDPYDSPSLVRTLFTPSQNRFIGPTPQKDGQVLGLFDLLSEEGEESPPKGHITITGPNGKVEGTPRKQINLMDDIQATNRYSRTPASSGKRFLLDSFATPLKGRSSHEPKGTTPSSVSKLNFVTPLFLRRDNQRATIGQIPEAGESLLISPEMVRLPRKPMVRGLSSMLAGLRKIEEDAADDDLDVLHEMENETMGLKKPMKSNSTILVEDSQAPILLGGFDDEAMYDSEPEEIKNPILGRDGQPLKIWKKKGQKRTTRRVTIKPVLHKKSQSTPQALPHSPSQETAPPDEEEEAAAVPETQQQQQQQQQQAEFTNTVSAAPAAEDAGNFDSDSASEYTASEGGTRYRRPDHEQQQKNKKKSKTYRSADGTVRRKVAASAHANFKRLKLRNSGAKGGVVPHNSRFRRRR